VESELTDRLEVAVSAARKAGQLTLDYFQRDDLQVERKDDDSPVTAADRQAEQLLRAQIQDAFPTDGILGEEFGEVRGESGFRWILDPIDGTISFVCGVPLYGTLVGVEYERNSVIGVINVPVLGECIYAARGGGAWYAKGDSPSRRATVSRRDRLADAVFLTSQVDSFAARDAAEAYLALERSARVTRTWGDCYGYLLVATGRADVMIDPILNVWDAAALQPVMEESGGVFCDWRGRPTIHSGEGIGCNRQLLPLVLDITRPFSKPS
jgi:histidinol phosphatase-like enzyme (inositol monophosphatase family)